MLALDSVQHLRDLGTHFSWIGIDGGYGKEPHFLSTLDDRGELFVADVHKNLPIYLEDPAPYITNQIARLYRYKPGLCSAAGRSLATHTTRNSTKGLLQVDVLVQRVWFWNKEETSARQWSLIIRREVDSIETIKYSLSNAPENTSAERLAFMQGQRYFVERAFQDAKGTADMDHYQIRGWQSWHHHISLVMMSMLFMAETRLKEKKHYPLLSCPDVALMLPSCLRRSFRAGIRILMRYLDNWKSGTNNVKQVSILLIVDNSLS